jgi:hypothetical protein
MGLEKAIDSNIYDLQDASYKTFSVIENLSPEIRNPLGEKFSSEYLRTVHDAIRYLHQKSIDVMFKQDYDLSHANLLKYKNKARYWEDKREDWLFVIDLTKSPRGISKILDPILKTYRRLTSKQESNKIPDSVPLKAILKFYEKQEEKSGCEEWKILCDKDYVNATIKLGAHSANLDTLIGDVPQNNYILFKYHESKGYKNSKNRQISYRSF